MFSLLHLLVCLSIVLLDVDLTHGAHLFNERKKKRKCESVKNPQCNQGQNIGMGEKSNDVVSEANIPL